MFVYKVKLQHSNMIMVHETHMVYISCKYTLR